MNSVMVLINGKLFQDIFPMYCLYIVLKKYIIGGFPKWRYTQNIQVRQF